MKHYKHLTKTDRLMIEKLLLKKEPVTKIANLIGVHTSTIYREIKRGMYVHTNSNLTEEERYSSDLAQSRYESSLKAKGLEKKIVNAPEVANKLEELIGTNKYSPAAALATVLKMDIAEGFYMCLRTLYNYIENGVFGGLKLDLLPFKGKRKEHHKKRAVRSVKNVMGVSIEKRDEEIISREEFGHWEMDTVKGKRESEYSMLVLTERKTRYELIFKIRHQAKSVVEVINNLEIEFGDKFREIFKTITMDNGREFSYTEQIQTSIKGGVRTRLYYCHPYSSWERGSNENQNILIRRHIPKGQDFDRVDESVFKKIQDWINNYPRKLFNWNCSLNLFDLELAKL